MISYKPLRYTLIDREMTWVQLRALADISKSTTDRMAQGHLVSLEIIDRICTALECPLTDVIEWVPADSAEGDSVPKKIDSERD